MIKFYDSKLKKKIVFSPLEINKVSMYVCGPTVYDVPHLGHGRSAVCFDVIRKYFIYCGYDVNYVSNYTDIDDKMINRANEEKISVEELANKVIPSYEDQYSLLSIMKPDSQPKATDHISEIIDLISKLEEKGLTYSLKDGVYFDVSEFPTYGELSHQKLEELKMGARIEVNKEKRNPYDFALWKFKKENEPFWPSPFGEGRPGWHIECSAMTLKQLGEKFDIHGGGLDLLFPHHECEVAQSKGAFGNDYFAQYWIHNGFIQINKEKMSKSLGNFFTLQDIFKQYDPKVVRLMFLQTHYRNPIEFSMDLLEQSKSALGRIHEFNRKLFIYKSTTSDKTSSNDKNLKTFLDDSKKKFEKSMADDFDTSGSLSVLFDLIKYLNPLFETGDISSNIYQQIIDFLHSIDSVLGVIFFEEEAVDKNILLLVNQREEARKSKDFELADSLRAEILEKGYSVEDTPQGPICKSL